MGGSNSYVESVSRRMNAVILKQGGAGGNTDDPHAKPITRIGALPCLRRFQPGFMESGCDMGKDRQGIPTIFDAPYIAQRWAG